MNQSSLHDSHDDYPTEFDFDVISTAESTQQKSLDEIIRRDKRKTISFKTKGNNRSSRASIVSEISDPMDVHRQIHVFHNRETGALEGLPLSWIRALNAEGEDEQPVSCVYEVYPIDKTFNERLRRQVSKPKQNTVSTFQKIKNWFSKKSEQEVLSYPTDFRHTLHVTRNPTTGELEGVPTKWLQELHQ